MQNKRILLLAPHDDDIVISFGGLIFDSIQKGYDIKVHVFAMGGPCSNVDPSVRIAEFNKVMYYYNITNYSYGLPGSDYPTIGLDGLMDTLPNCYITGFIDKLCDEYKPTDIYCTADSAHADHHALYTALMASIRLKSGWMVSSIYLGEYQFLPSTYINNVGGKEYLPLTKSNFNSKCEAFLMHKSQLKPSPSPLGIGGVTTLAKMRGMEIGEEYAELYYCIKRIRYNYIKD